MNKLYLHILLLLMVNLSWGYDFKKPDLKIIPPADEIRVQYNHNFPFEMDSSEKLEEAIERVFYNLLVKELTKSLTISDAEIKNPDAFPFYEKVDPRSSLKEGFFDLPSSNFEFTFNNQVPHYVFQIDSLAIYSSSSINDDGGGGAVGGGIAPVTSIIATATVNAIKSANANNLAGGIGVEFKYFIWDNKMKKIIDYNYCQVLNGSSDITKEDWEKIVSKIVTKIFYTTSLHP